MFGNRNLWIVTGGRELKLGMSFQGFELGLIGCKPKASLSVHRGDTLALHQYCEAVGDGMAYFDLSLLGVDGGAAAPD
jgi:hypothetical protein